MKTACPRHTAHSPSVNILGHLDDRAGTNVKFLETATRMRMLGACICGILERQRIPPTLGNTRVTIIRVGGYARVCIL